LSKGELRKTFDWCKEFPLRMEFSGDAPLFCKENNKINMDNTSRLSPVTNILLNTIVLDPKNSNFIISFPSFKLKPLPLITYIISKKYNQSVLVFSRHYQHYKNYYLLKNNYGFVWYDVPAGLFDTKGIIIKPYTPYATRSFSSQLKQKIPFLRNVFFDEKRNKVLFYKKPTIKFTNSIKELYLKNKNIGSSDIEQDLNINVIVFENLDNYVYNKLRLDNFIQWIKPLYEKDIKFIFHISNPFYELLDDLKTKFNAYVLYFPFSFLKANEDLRNKTSYYFSQLHNCKSNVKRIISDLNLDENRTYSEEIHENILIHRPLRKGNIDRYFRLGMDLFNRISWSQIPESLKIFLYKIKQLFFKVYKMLALPEEFSVRHIDEDLGPLFFPLIEYIYILNRQINTYSKDPVRHFLKMILSYLLNMVNELSECRRYGEKKTFSRKGKNFALCKYLEKNENEQIVIAVQSGERKAIFERLQRLNLHNNVKIYTLTKLSRISKDFPKKILLLSSRLIPSHFPILFKKWKQVVFFVYNGKDEKWVKDDLDLLEHIDISREELSLKYLAEIIKLIAGENYKLENDPLFQNFIEKKRKLLSMENQEGQEVKVEEILEQEVEISTTSISDLCRKIMEQTQIYSDTIDEVEVKKIIKNYENSKAEIFKAKHKEADVLVTIENLSTGDSTFERLNIDKRYMYFKDTKDVKIKFAFPYSLNEDDYIVLFGKQERLSLTDFIKVTFGLEDDIDHKIIEGWQGRLARYYFRNYDRITDFYKDFTTKTSSTISYAEFGNWVRGNVNYTQDPEHLYNLGLLLDDPYFLDNYLLIHEEGKKIQSFNLNLSKKLKYLVSKILEGDISRDNCTLDELDLLDKIEDCIYKILKITINKEVKK